MAKRPFGHLQDEINVREKNLGLDMSNILDLPDTTREVITWMLRETQVDLAQLTTHLGQDEASARALIASLLDQGYVHELDLKGQVHYRVRLKPKHTHNMPSNLWRAVEDEANQ